MLDNQMTEEYSGLVASFLAVTLVAGLALAPESVEAKGGFKIGKSFSAPKTTPRAPVSVPKAPSPPISVPKAPPPPVAAPTPKPAPMPTTAPKPQQAPVVGAKSQEKGSTGLNPRTAPEKQAIEVPSAKRPVAENGAGRVGRADQSVQQETPSKSFVLPWRKTAAANKNVQIPAYPQARYNSYRAPLGSFAGNVDSDGVADALLGFAIRYVRWNYGRLFDYQGSNRTLLSDVSSSGQSLTDQCIVQRLEQGGMTRQQILEGQPSVTVLRSEFETRSLADVDGMIVVPDTYVGRVVEAYKKCLGFAALSGKASGPALTPEGATGSW